MTTPNYNAISPDVLARLRAELGEEAVSTDPVVLADHAKDATDDRFQPEVVVFAESAEQVSRLLRLANELRFPVTPRGAGTGLAGGALPELGGAVLSLARMTRVEIEADNLVAVAEAGALTKDVKAAAKAAGLFYPPDPASLETSSIGGNAATNAGGPACLKYGVTRHYVLGLEAVLPTGEIVSTGARTRKNVVGYDLTGLLVGSEGTLGIVTKLWLKLVPHPAAVTTLVACFPDMGAAMRAVAAVLTGGVLPSALEFLDHRCLNLIGDLLPFPVTPSSSLLLIEADGDPEQIARDMAKVRSICAGVGAFAFIDAPDAESRAKVWDVRRQVSLRIHDSAAGPGLYIPEDVVAPIGRIADLVEALPSFEERHGFAAYAFGHAGDGNIHLNFVAPSDEHLPRAWEGVAAILKLVVEMGGTISGEHGIGRAKKPFLGLELSPESMKLQAGLKRLFDPNLILNPAKLFT